MIDKKQILSASVFTGIGLVAGLLVAALIVHLYPYSICLHQCQQAITAERIFYTDELTAYGKDSSGNPLLINLSLSRRKVQDTYQHYYYANINVGGFQKQDYTTFNSPNREVQAHDFLKTFANPKAEDLSTRESFQFTYENGPVNIEVKSSDLEGDFITKNSLEYTRYVNEGEALITIGGKAYQARIATVQSYANDYSKYVYFDGYGITHSLAQVFTLWDDKNNFYFLDKSEVFDDNPNYKSHTWVLYKDAEGKSMKKSFAATIDTTKTNGASSAWNIDIPDLAAQISLQSKITFDGKVMGVAQGSVTSSNVVGSIGGYYTDQEYNK